MSVLDCASAMIVGAFDVFDSAAAVADWLLEEVEDRDMPVELCPEGHFTDREAELRAELERAKKMIYEACQICQNTLAALP